MDCGLTGNVIRQTLVLREIESTAGGVISSLEGITQSSLSCFRFHRPGFSCPGPCPSRSRNQVRLTEFGLIALIFRASALGTGACRGANASSAVTSPRTPNRVLFRGGPSFQSHSSRSARFGPQSVQHHKILRCIDVQQFAFPRRNFQPMRSQLFCERVQGEFTGGDLRLDHHRCIQRK